MANKKPVVIDSLGEIQLITNGDYLVPSSLGSDVADSTKFLRGDNVWAVPSGTGGGGGTPQITVSNTPPSSPVVNQLWLQIPQ